MQEVVIVEACRTPIGKHRGALSRVRADDLAALCISGVLKRAKLDGKAVPLTRFVPRDVLLGNEHNTIIYERSPQLQKRVFDLFSTSHSPDSSAWALRHRAATAPPGRSRSASSWR